MAEDRQSLVRAAYEEGDVEASKAAHGMAAPEEHPKHGEMLKAIIYGGLDGIITTFSIVSAANGGNLGVYAVLILGFSNIFADAMSMGMSSWLSEKAEMEYILKEEEREKWELENHKEGEIQEMVDLFVAKGVSDEHARMIIGKMAQYEDLFLDVMMVQELNLNVPDGTENPAMDGLITFLSFVGVGSVPLWCYAILWQSGLTPHDLFAISVVMTCLALFLLGVFKTKFSVTKWYVGGIEILGLGGAAAMIAYGIGAFITNVILGGNALAAAANGI
jgi:DNA damage-binding protein 1